MKLIGLNRFYIVCSTAIALLASVSPVSAQEQGEGQTFEEARINIVEAVSASNDTGRLRVRESDGVDCIACGEDFEYDLNTRLRLLRSGQQVDIRNLANYASGDVTVYIYRQGYVSEIVVPK